MMYTQFVQCVSCIICTLLTGVADLFKVKDTLKNVVRWRDLGLALGLLEPTLQKIDIENRGKVDDCMREMLVVWLQQKDNVSHVGVPSSWMVLKTSLRKIGENKLASNIST